MPSQGRDDSEGGTGQPDGDGGSFAGAAGGGDRAAMGHDQAPGDGQPEPAAAGIGRLLESLEHARGGFLAHAAAGVLDLDQDLVAHLTGAQRDGAPFRRVAKRVGDQVVEHLRHAKRVDADRGRRGRFGDDGDALAGGHGVVGGGDIADEVAGMGIGEKETDRTGFGIGEHLQVVEEAPHGSRAFQQGFEVLAVGGINVVEHALDGALDDGEGSSQFVGDVGEQALALLLVGLEPLGHGVEGGHHPARFARTAGGDAGRQVTVGHAVGGVYNLGERPEGAHDLSDEKEDDGPNGQQGERRPEERSRRPLAVGWTPVFANVVDDGQRQADQDKDADGENREPAANRPAWAGAAGRPRLALGPPGRPLIAGRAAERPAMAGILGILRRRHR